MYSFLSTVFVSGILYISIVNPDWVKILKMVIISRKPKTQLCLVGSPVTLRSLSLNNKSELKWNQWLAGLIDGDGCLLVSKDKYTSCEITMDIKDEKALLQIKQKLGGSVKLRAGLNAIRYRIHNKPGMIDLITRINGHIRNSLRLKQLELVCNALDINLIKPSVLNNPCNGWFSGFFDADGTITCSIKNNHPQLTISVSNKHEENIKDFKSVFGGNIYFDKGGYGSYKWSIQSKKDVEMFLEYIKIYPSRSHKNQRFFLIPKYYKLKLLKAYKQDPGSALDKAWQRLIEDWKNRG